MITRKDAEKHGYTRRCAGCISFHHGLPRQAHTAACRSRFENEMKHEAKVLRAAEQQEEFKRKVAEKRKMEDNAAESRRRRVEGKGSMSHYETEGARDVIVENEMDHDARHEDDRNEAMAETEPRATLVRVREDDSDTGEVRKRVRIGGVEAEEALKNIEKWIMEMRIEWERNEAEADSWLEGAWDDVKGGELSVQDVKKARKEEVEYMIKRKIWRVVPTAECWRKTGRPPIGTRWVDTNKGSTDKPDVRCRLVARDFKVKTDKDREDLFAATPPVEAERMAERTFQRR